MSNYILFAGENYYPSAGSGDIVKISPYLDELILSLKDLFPSNKKDEIDWAEIYHIENEEIVYSAWVSSSTGSTVNFKDHLKSNDD